MSSTANTSRDAALADALWKKSTRSGGQNECVEVTKIITD